MDDVERAVNNLFDTLPESKAAMEGEIPEKASVMRRCEDCGELFEAGGRKRYCPKCRTERQLAGMRDRKIECESCGETFRPRFGAQKLCDACRADPEKVREWKERQNLRVIRAAKDSGAECTNEHTHFPGLAEERRRKRQPVMVDLSNFIPVKVTREAPAGKTEKEPVMEENKVLGELAADSPEKDARKNIRNELLRTAQALAKLSEATGTPVEAYLDAIAHFASGFVVLRSLETGHGEEATCRA